MRPKDLLVAIYDAEKGVAVIGVHQREESIQFLGASCRANMTPGEYGDAATIVPVEGEKHVVALRVTITHSGKRSAQIQNDECHYFFIEVDGGDKTKPVNLDEQWISPSDRLAGAGGHAVMAEIDGTRYVGCEYPKYGVEPSGHYVDPNLICKYLVGKATAEEVKAAAEEFRNDEPFLDQKEQKELLAEVERLRNDNVSLSGLLRMAQQHAAACGCECKHHSAKIVELQESNGNLHATAWRLYDAARGQWFKSSALREAMKTAEREGLNSD